MTHPLTLFRTRHKPPLSKADLARLLETSRTSITRWEAWDRRISEAALPLIAERTGIPAGKLRPDLAALFE